MPISSVVFISPSILQSVPVYQLSFHEMDLGQIWYWRLLWKIYQENPNLVKIRQ